MKTDENILVPAWPKDYKRLRVEIFYIVGEPPFVCGCYGNMPDYEELIESFMGGAPEKEGIYLFDCVFNRGQYGEFGMVEIPPYWELEEIGFKALSDIKEQNNEKS
jgi:hypothetical protein